MKRAVTVRERRAFLLWNVCGLLALCSARLWPAWKPVTRSLPEGKEARWYTRID